MTTRIKRTSAFKRDQKREFKTHGVKLDTVLVDVLAMLVIGESLPGKYKNHLLLGEFEGLSECHLRPDLLLVYDIIKENEDDDLIILYRLGSHTEIFG